MGQEHDRGCREATCLPPGEGSTFCGLFTYPRYLVENLAKGFGLLYQVPIAVSTYLAGSLKVGWCPSKTSKACAAP